MTAKRYRKLFGALMAQNMQGENGAGRCIKAARHATPKWSESCTCYQQAWDQLCQHDLLRCKVVDQYLNRHQ